MIAGTVESSICRIIHEMLDRLLAILSREHDARIQWPSPQEIQQYQSLIEARHPHLRPRGIFGFIDGLQLRCKNHSNPAIQNAFYNGHKHDVFISNIVVIAPDGTVCMAVVNHPGSHHDAKVAKRVYGMLETSTPQNAYLLGDSAFQYMSNKIVTPWKANQYDSDPTICRAQKRQCLERRSARQAVEWGNKDLQTSFPRLTEELKASNWTFNQKLISSCIHLSNLRVRRLRTLNQISTFFQSEI